MGSGLERRSGEKKREGSGRTVELVLGKRKEADWEFCFSAIDDDRRA